jgi:hypothetical protein
VSEIAGAVTIDELRIADEPERWRELGFAVQDGCCQIGSVRIALAGSGEGKGIVGWSLRELSSPELDGLATARSSEPLPPPPAEHPNGVSAIDHVVAISPALDRTVVALQAAGLSLRRIRDEPTPAGAPRQAFFRLGGEILEVVQEPERIVAEAGGPDRPARLWGLALIAPDLDRTVEQLAPHASAPHDAVQPGRRISTVRRSAGLTFPLALMSPPPSTA